MAQIGLNSHRRAKHKDTPSLMSSSKTMDSKKEEEGRRTVVDDLLSNSTNVIFWGHRHICEYGENGGSSCDV